MKAAIYTRVSTHHQIDKDSLPLQREELINYSKYVLNSKDYVIYYTSYSINTYDKY